MAFAALVAHCLPACRVSGTPNAKSQCLDIFAVVGISLRKDQGEADDDLLRVGGQRNGRGSARPAVGPAKSGMHRPLTRAASGPHLRLGEPRPRAQQCHHEHPALSGRSRGWRYRVPLLPAASPGSVRTVMGRRARDRSLSSPSKPSGRARSSSSHPYPSATD